MKSYVINIEYLVLDWWRRGSDLAGRLDALEDAQIDDGPGHKEQAKQLPADTTGLLDAIRLLQKLPTERHNMYENTEIVHSVFKDQSTEKITYVWSCLYFVVEL